MKTEAQQALEQFIEEWEESSEKPKASFLKFKEYLGDKSGVALDFIPRAGVTYSLRARQANQTEKELFVMVDVIEDNPRWLSVCFYGEMITDPEERGDFASEARFRRAEQSRLPEGLLGEDAACFDLEENDEALIRYIQARMDEAWAYAAKG